ncbi:hypothetical protein A2210_02045 [Candidatus Woesebacteria bacterium RIFOXYA1_FULL_40_18]|uniref:Uncharacterized protein n=3 Tax=Candidatus Woeseibacteriota TaxID=1752722 RepID=A0A1F8CJN1_9BACT|nr:MAG: hypothetical protein A2210_02045 [Candidatus Woesebacteria bacterium RIFOXYA1_FULL_40_18]OGM81419.1 MAG: hypothetical protein A2361_01805 [Candidatus Woesebacteria bacterium RIFOXYB1_FULL_40_26]OGM87613.1 MAG: hypothetical protein A2614_01465 [Candidatus Woesebacteria bacterium RIFOXYD1_FULL_40_21]
MKKFLPLILLVVGLGVLTAVYFFVIKPSGEAAVEEEIAPEVALENRPVASLSPSSDGHWLELNITKIKISAVSLDYELLYNLPDGRKQGVPGSVKLANQTSVERDLLLGSESSGKYRYDEGVETGTLTLRFRNGQGKLAAKFVTDFHLQSNTSVLTSADGKFSYTLDKNSGKEFLVVMQTFGYPNDAPGTISSGPYGVFKATAKVSTAKGALSSTTKVFPGQVSMSGTSIYKATSSAWDKLTGRKADDVGIFIGTSE